MKNRVTSLLLLLVVLFAVTAAAAAAWRLPTVKTALHRVSREASEISRKTWRNLMGANALAAEPPQQQATQWPTLNEQLQKAKVRPGTALEQLIRANQDFSQLRPDEINDKRGLPPWLRAMWRKAHPELKYLATDPTGGYPHVLKEVLEWMEWHQDLRSGMGTRPTSANQQKQLKENEEGEEQPQAPNIAITNEQRISGAQSSARSESDIRINFFDPTKILSASNAISSSGQQAIFYSTNSGATWGQTALELQAGDAFNSDPTVEWTSDGRGWSSTLGINAAGTVLKLRNFYTTNNGADWTFEATPSGTQNSVDKQMVWVDHSATSPYFNRMYAIWHNGLPAFMNRRTAGAGGTWLTNPIQVSGAESTGTCIGSDVKTNSAGDVFGFWPTTTNGKVFVVKSTNGGDSFGTPIQAATTYDTYDIGVPSFNGRRILIYVSGAAYRTPSKNLVYAAWTDLSGETGCVFSTNEPGNNVASTCKTRIWFARSTDGGATWSAKIRVNHQASLNDQFNQWLAVDETTGALGIMYYDTVADSGRKKTHVYYQHSFDDGVTWSTPQQVTTAQTDETTLTADDGNQYGDYNGLSAYAGVLFPSWTDRRADAREEIWTAKITDAPCTAPGVPTITGVTATAANQLTVNWTNGAPTATSFNVYRALGTCAAPGAYALIASSVTGTSYVDNSVSGSVTYSYKISGKEATGACESAQSTCSQGTATGVCNLPPTFAGLNSVSNSALATCTLSLSWSAGTASCGGPLNYRIYRSTASGFTPGAGNLIATVSGNSYSDSGSLMSGTTYYYVVRAVDNATGLAESNTVERSGTPSGPITITNMTETFEAPSGFDNSGWTHASLSGGVDWAWSTAQSQTPTHGWFSASQDDIADRVLVSPPFTVQANTTLSFWHTYAFEGNVSQGYDGGTLEYSTNDGATWTVMPDARFTAGLFNGTINSGFGNPLGGSRGWVSGTLGAMTQVSVNLSTFAGQSMKLRWHAGEDGSVAATGWYVDSVTISNAGFPGTCMPISCPTITGTVTGGGAICAGGTATVTVTVTGGTAPYTVTLNNGGSTQTGAGPFTFNVSPGATTTYSVAAGSVDSNSCVITGSGSATVTVTPLPTAANAGSDQSLCSLAATLAGNTPNIGTGTWSKVSGPGTISFSNANLANSTATASLAGAYTLRWTIANGACTSFDDVNVTFTATPTPAAAGPDQNICGLGATLAANTPGVGTGAWSQVNGSGTVTFGSAGSPASTATASVAGAYTLRWTITNGSCTSSDEVVINYSAVATTAAAGTDQTVCGLAATLVGNAPSVGTGTWTKVGGPGTVTFGNANAPGTTATASVAGAYTLRWTIANGACTSFDEVNITYTTPPTTANAGPDQSLCSLAATLAANTPGVGTGTWSQVSGPGTITFGSTSSPASTVTASMAGVYTLRWTIANGSCTSTDDVVITLTAPPTSAAAGPDQTLCGLGATLAANAPAVGTGTWTKISGPGTVTFGNANAPASTATVSVAGAYTLRWTIANGSCTSTDEVVISYSAAATTAQAGPDQALCGLGATLAGNTPTVGTGAWTKVSGPGTVTFNNANAPNATATVSVAGAYTLRWTIENGACVSFDEVTLAYTATPTTANAGPDQAVCNLIATLAGNVPSVGTSTWTQVNGPGTVTFNNANVATTTVTASIAGAYTLRWTIANGSCTSADEVIVNYGAAPTTSNAGPDQTACGLVATLAGNTPSLGTGTWTKVSGPGTVAFNNANAPGAMATVSVAGAYVLRWTIASGSCTSTDDVAVSFTTQPTTAAAGPDQNVCALATTLAGNTPSVGTGTWTQVSGPGTVTFGNANTPNSAATASVAGAYTLRWTIANSGCTSADDVVVTYTAPPTAAAAGPDQNLCGLEATLAGNTPSVGTGTWSKVSGPGTVTFSNASSPTATATASVAGAYTLRWTVANGSCTSTDDVAITLTAQPTAAAAGPDQSVCGLIATLAGNTPTVGNGTWTSVSGPGTVTFNNAHSPTATATASVAGAYSLRWTIANSNCTSTDEVVITYTAQPTTAAAGPDQSVCNLGATLAGNTPSTGTGAWTQVSGPGTVTFNNANTPNATATASVVGVYTLRWTIANNSCTSTDDVVITFSAQPAAAAAGPDQSVCGLTTSLAGNTPNLGTGTWTQVSGPGTITFGNANTPNSQATASVVGAYTLRWTIANGGCISTDDVVITYSANAINITPASLPSAQTGQAYSQQLTASGGNAPYAFTLLSGSLPTGITLSNTGLIAGMTAVAGAAPITVKVTDANGCISTQAYTLVVTVTCNTITLDPATLPGGTVSVVYANTQLTASGGTAPYNFAVINGTVPPGLTLTTSGLLSGTPTQTVTVNLEIEATDANGCKGSRTYNLIINSGGAGLQFFPLPAPVRLLDTRNGASPNACSQPNAPIAGGTSRLQPGRNTCTIPANAAALTGNITTVNSGGGFLTLYPSDATQPTVASTNYGVNEIINNVFTVGLGADGAFRIFAQNTTEVVVDVTGYYAPPGTANPVGLYFHPLPAPVRLLETRAGFSGCAMPGMPLTGNADSTQLATSACTGIPASARAIVGNVTTVEPQSGGFLTLFPADATRPLVAASNFNAGQIVNGPFSVGLAPNGGFKIYTTSTTHLVVDVLGYYSTEANDVNGAGLLFTPLAKPVRLLETRASQPVGCYKPGIPLRGDTEVMQPARGLCDGITIPANALAVVGNATVITPVGAGFLTLWPSSATQPLVATSNYNAGDISNRHFIVGLGNADGAFKLYSFATTHLVIDLSGYFAP